MKENKKEYLRRILKVTRYDAWYSEMDTFMREYNNFIKAFNVEEIRGGEIEKIFIDFHKNGLTPAKLVELQKGREKLEQQLLYYSQKAKQYFETDIKKKRYDEIVKTRFPKDAMIELVDLERIHSLTGSLSDIRSFLDNLHELWGNFMNELYSTVDLIFSGHYEADIIRIEEFDKVVDEEITYYRKRVSQYEESFEQADIYYVGKNDNPYKNIFLYCLNSYIKNFYPIDIVTMQPGVVGKLNCIVMSEKKEKYTLEDVAKAYSDMSGETYEKSYGKIKQQFRKSPFMQQMKKGRSYEFDCIEMPLATYVYYSKKNHVEPEFSRPVEMYDKFTVHFYAPLLRANMWGENKKLEAFNRYAEFVNSEFKKLTETVNDAYLDTLSEELFLTSLHLKCRCMRGFDLERAIGYRG
jgi:hypothetical protein